MRKLYLRNTWLILASMVTSLFLGGCQKDITGDASTSTTLSPVKIQFTAVVDADPLLPGKPYKNAFGEEYSISAFRFYIHRIEFFNSRTNTVASAGKDDHYLINTTDPVSSSITVKVPGAEYDGIRFSIGVDSIRNVSGAQTGPLDPAQGMFWTWSTGYIMAKLEGHSPVAATPNSNIEYHIGGFKAGENVIRKVSLPFTPGQQVDLKQQKQSTITLSANVNRWFNHINQIRISQKPVSMSPGTLAIQIADNYASMFTVVQIVNE